MMLVMKSMHVQNIMYKFYLCSCVHIFSGNILIYIVSDHGIFKPINRPEELIERSMPAIPIGHPVLGNERKPFRFRDFTGKRMNIFKLVVL